MKLTRRKFFTGLAAAPLVPVAIAVAGKLPAPENKSLILAKWSPTKYEGYTTIRTSLPALEWRKIKPGEKPLLGYNEILADLKWTKPT